MPKIRRQAFKVGSRGPAVPPDGPRGGGGNRNEKGAKRMLQRQTVIIVDPSADFRQRLKDAIYEHETLVDVVDAESVGEVTGILRDSPPDVVFTEIDLPPQEGLRLIASIRRTVPDCRIIVLAGRDAEATRTTALQNGADDFLIKEDAVGLRLVDLIHGAVRRR